MSGPLIDNLTWTPIPAEVLELIVNGSTVTGAEPIDAPLTDGLIIYLTDRSGRQLVLDIGADPMTDPEENPFYIRIAEADRE